MSGSAANPDGVATQTQRVGLLWDGQVEGFAQAWRLVWPGCELRAYDAERLGLDAQLATRISHAMHDCQSVVSLDFGQRYGALAGGALARMVPRLLTLPKFEFSGFHPDCVRIELDGAAVAGRLGVHHSRLALAGFLAGLSCAETADLFNPLVFRRAGYDKALLEGRTRLVARFAAYGLDLAPVLAEVDRLGIWMHAPAEPSFAIWLGLARAVGLELGLGTPAEVPETAAQLPPPATTPPVWLQTAKLLRMAEAVPARAEGRALGEAEWLAAAYGCFAGIPRLVLREVPSVRALMASLGLAEQAALDSPPALLGAGLLSRDGKLLRVELASTRLLLRPVWPQAPGEADFRLLLPAGRLRAPLRLPVLDGIECTPEEDGALVRVRRGRGHLSAPAGRLMAVFAPQPEPEGAFLALPHERLAALRLLLGHSWRVSGRDHAVPRGAIRLEEDFTLELAGQRFDLRHAGLIASEDAQGNPLLLLQEGGAQLALQLDAQADARAELLLREAKLPDEVASIAAFRLERSGCLHIAGPAARLHPPLSVSDLDRDWLAGMLERPQLAGLTGGFAPMALKLRVARAENATVLLSAGHEGCLISEAGVHRGLAVLRMAAELPAGLRLDSGHVLADPETLGQGPLVEGPVCIPYGPGLERYGAWALGGLLQLHAMAPYLPEETRLVLPGTIRAAQEAGGGFDVLETLRALGLTQFKVLELAAPRARLEQAIWLDGTGLTALPAHAMRGMRARLLRGLAAMGREVPKARGKRIYVRQSGARRVVNAQPVEMFLRHNGFDCVEVERMSPLAQMELFAQASFVVAPHGLALANLLFCAPGTKVMEFMPEAALRPDYWLLSERLGLNYAMLPAPTQDGNFNGAMVVEARRMRGLFRMLSNRD